MVNKDVYILKLYIKRECIPDVGDLVNKDTFIRDARRAFIWLKQLVVSQAYLYFSSISGNWQHCTFIYFF